MSDGDNEVQVALKIHRNNLTEKSVTGVLQEDSILRWRSTRVVFVVVVGWLVGWLVGWYANNFFFFFFFFPRTHTHARTLARSHACTPARTHALTHTHTQSHACTKTHTHTHAQTHTHTHTHTHTPAHAYIYTQTHTDRILCVTVPALIMFTYFISEHLPVHASLTWNAPVVFAVWAVDKSIQHLITGVCLSALWLYLWPCLTISCKSGHLQVSNGHMPAAFMKLNIGC